MKLSIRTIKKVLHSIKLLILCCLLFSFQHSFSGIIGDTHITGRVLKYNKHKVTLSQYGNRRITVPIRSLKKDFKKLKTGLLVTAVFSAEEVMDAIEIKAKQQQIINKKQLKK